MSRKNQPEIELLASVIVEAFKERNRIKLHEQDDDDYDDDWDDDAPAAPDIDEPPDYSFHGDDGDIEDVEYDEPAPQAPPQAPPDWDHLTAKYDYWEAYGPDSYDGLAQLDDDYWDQQTKIDKTDQQSVQWFQEETSAPDFGDVGETANISGLPLPPSVVPPSAGYESSQDPDVDPDFGPVSGKAPFEDTRVWGDHVEETLTREQWEDLSEEEQGQFKVDKNYQWRSPMGKHGELQWPGEEEPEKHMYSRVRRANPGEKLRDQQLELAKNLDKYDTEYVRKYNPEALYFNNPEELYNARVDRLMGGLDAYGQNPDMSRAEVAAAIALPRCPACVPESMKMDLAREHALWDDKFNEFLVESGFSPGDLFGEKAAYYGGKRVRAAGAGVPTALGAQAVGRGMQRRGWLGRSAKERRLILDSAKEIKGAVSKMSGKDLKKWLKANRVAREATMSADEIADTRKAWKALEKARGGSALSQFRAAQIVRGGRLAQAGRGAKSLLRKVGKHPAAVVGVVGAEVGFGIYDALQRMDYNDIISRSYGEGGATGWRSDWGDRYGPPEERGRDRANVIRFYREALKNPEAWDLSSTQKEKMEDAVKKLEADQAAARKEVETQQSLGGGVPGGSQATGRGVPPETERSPRLQESLNRWSVLAGIPGD